MDPVSNFLNKLKLAARTGKESFFFPASRFIVAIANVLQKAGYVVSVGKKGKRGRLVEITLASSATGKKINGIRRVSHLSQRVYRAVREIRKVRSGYGMAVFSTPKGVLSDKDARAARAGGEALFEIW